MGESYSCASGGVIAAGRYRQPLWRRGLTPLAWGLQGSNTLNDIDPRYDATANPDYPNIPPWSKYLGGSYMGGQSTVMEAWGGGAFDEASGWFYVTGGGHADYAGNEVYRINLYVDNPTWERYTNPTVDVETGRTLIKYGDGSPVSHHTYWNLFVHEGELYTFGGSVYHTGSGPVFLAHVDKNTRQWVFDWEPTGTPPFQDAWGICAYSPTQKKVYRGYSYDFSPVWAMDLTTKTFGSSLFAHGPALGGYTAAHWNDKRQCLMYVNHSAGVPVVRVWAPGESSTFGSPANAGTVPTLTGYEGMCYDSDLDRYYIWHGGPNHGNLITLTPPPVGQSPRTNDWTWGTLAAASGTPPSFAGSGGRNNNAAFGGTFGRLFYSSRLKAVGVISRTVDKIAILPLG